MKKTKGYAKGGAMKKMSGEKANMPQAMKMGGACKTSVMKKMDGGAMKPAKKSKEGTRMRRPAPVESPKYKDPLAQALEEERRIKEANEPAPVQKKKSGGMCRGMGAAKKGGNYKAS